MKIKINDGEPIDVVFKDPTLTLDQQKNLLLGAVELDDEGRIDMSSIKNVVTVKRGI